MSQQDGFLGGFLAGAVVGGLVGGAIGALITSRSGAESENNDASLLNASGYEAKAGKGKKRQLRDAESIELARRSLEDKIAQLNSAIDEVRQQLVTVNGNGLESDRERSLNEDY